MSSASCPPPSYLVHSPSLSHLLSSVHRHPSNYVGLSLSRPASALESLLHRSRLGRAVRRDEEGDVRGKEGAVEEARRERDDLRKAEEEKAALWDGVSKGQEYNALMRV
eukprot:CAMPEP_0182466602 /NCGR_PEP_ID=MMETSP1319-20130603/12358_1 /TAXON_ID=172717 /ORGANISM="Bolidomonas pacifica, Strain RCC208" /LENGTH=108 /DNA_ID=CAMNT_0024666615 /DNA_START=206 /DNA_END=528 /DNA_ORIENTATION=-